MTAVQRGNSIKDWKVDDRPREKLILKGITALSDAELIAILLGSGSSEKSALDLARQILASAKNSLNNLGKLSVNNLCSFKGVGTVKALKIISALELGRRKRLETALENINISSSRAVFELMQPLIGELGHEEFWILYLNNSNKILFKDQLSIGGITGTLVDVRLLFKKALELSAVAIILCHNHPSGTLKPSKSDKDLTQKILQSGKTLDIRILDHIIITEKAYFSFADSNMI